MTCTNINGVRVLSYDQYTITVNGRDYWFIQPYSCGIGPMNKEGSMRESPWPKTVWNAVQRWSDQGRRVDENDKCVYT